MPGGIRGWFDKIGPRDKAAHERRDAAAAAAAAGAMPIAECRDRQSVVLQGRLEDLVVRPHGITPWLEASLRDASGAVTLVWMGRGDIPGIEEGRHMRVAGRISDADGHRRIYNPNYTLL